MDRSQWDAVKLFALNNQLLEHSLDQVEEVHRVDLRRGYGNHQRSDDAYYPQIESDIRAEAARMAPHYEVFYSLEKAVRLLVADTLAADEGADWWEGGRVPQVVKDGAESRRTRELDSGMTPRSDEPLDFTTFCELGDIIKKNWDVFGSLFTSVKAVERVMSNLNTLRGPIAHCSPLAEDEVVRLRLSVRDWFRLME